VLVQVGGDAGAGHRAQVDADVEALGPGGLAQRADRALGELGELGRLGLGQVGVVGHVPERADQHVARVVRVQVEHRVHQLAPGDDQALFVAELRRAVERAALVLARA